MIEPMIAAVRPRVVFADGPDAVLLEDEVRSRLDDGNWGILEVTGTLGGGKSTALAHLAAVFAGEPRLVLNSVPDDPIGWDNLSRIEQRAVVVVGIRADLKPIPGGTRCRLPIWGLDDWIEYLMARHRDQLSTVIARVQASRTARLLLGNAELWCAALDEMAADPTVSEPATALHRLLSRELVAAAAVSAAQRYAFARRCGSSSSEVADLESHLKSFPLPARASRLLRHDVALDLLAVDEVIALLQSETPQFVLGKPLPLSLLLHVAPQLAERANIIKVLRRALAGGLQHTHATSASLLHAAGVEFLPDNEGTLNLNGAQLAGVNWPGLRADVLRIDLANLSHADLHDARINSLQAEDAKLCHARLPGARIKHLYSPGSEWQGANLSYVRADQSSWFRSDLRRANLTGAWLPKARLISADLREAKFARADLSNANFTDAKLDEADFSGANLAEAHLASLNLRRARFDGAILRGANLAGSDLEEIEVHGADLEGAWLRFANLTGSSLPAARLAGASLFGAYLAYVDWERADLRDVDFTGASFHMGSSRSGLVGSPIACEGSRTGFYTDDFNDQDFKPPEEIRKANLRGCDLRGAKIDHVDFYLVDLREAKYTPYQRALFESCGAILETRV